MSSCKVHNVRFYKPGTRSVNSTAIHSRDKKLALARLDGSIEIWDLNYTPFIERTFVPNSDNNSIEAVVWCGDKLFSVGLHGFLVEYDLYKLDIKRQLSVTGEAAYCLDSSPKNQIAVGTDQGYLNIFSVNHDDDEVLFDKFLDKQEGKIVSLQFDQTGDFVVTGSMDAIRIWSVATGHALHRMTTGRTETKTPTIVWCLKVTSDFTIISGDSRGKLTFWDGKQGAQIESYKTHKADILSICLSEDQNTLYCAGADPTISSHVKINVKDGFEKWVRSIQRRIHDHDVRSLQLVGEKLYSAGIDGYLACSFHPPKTLLMFPPIMQNSCTDLSPDTRCILLKHPKSLEIWRLGENKTVSKDFKGAVPVQKGPKKLLVVQRVATNADGDKIREGIRCSCLSRDGNWLYYSTKQGSRVFKVNLMEKEPSLSKIQWDHSTETAVQAIFTPNSARLIVAPSTGGLKIFSLENDSIHEVQKLDLDMLKDTIVQLHVSECLIVVADTRSNILVLTEHKNAYKMHCKLPLYNIPLTALAIHPSLLTVVVSYADNTLVEYDIRKKEFSKFSRTLQSSKTQQKWLQRTNAVRNILFNPNNDNVLTLQDDNSMLVIKKDQELPEPDAKIPKIDASRLSDVKRRPGFYSVVKYKHLLNLNWLSDDEMVAVEVNPLRFIESLPPAFVQSCFGKK